MGSKSISDFSKPQSKLEAKTEFQSLEGQLLRVLPQTLRSFSTRETETCGEEVWGYTFTELPKSFTTLAPLPIPSGPRRGFEAEWILTEYRKKEGKEEGRKGGRNPVSATKIAVGMAGMHRATVASQEPVKIGISPSLLHRLHHPAGI